MPGALELDEHADGSMVVLAPDRALVIRLPENPTTGYRWVVEWCGAMRLDMDEFFPVGVGVGAGGSRRLQFSGSATGIHRIALALRRQWDTASAAIGRFSVTVVNR